jgi:hypothetical protein
MHGALLDADETISTEAVIMVAGWQTDRVPETSTVQHDSLTSEYEGYLADETQINGTLDVARHGVQCIHTSIWQGRGDAICIACDFELLIGVGLM